MGDLKEALHRFQAEVSAWSQRNFPDGKPHQPLLGVGEESGELMHAHLKAEQGIRGTVDEHHAAKIDAVGDIVIYLADYCARNGLTLGGAVEKTWAKVGQRDWRTDPTGGRVKP